MSAIAIIPARGGSKRLPRKNILPFRGRPMLSWPVENAKKSGVFDRVIVSSEDAEVMDVARKAGAEVVKRPVEFSTDEAHELDAVVHVLDGLEKDPDYFCLVYPTAILLEPQDFQESFKLLESPVQADVVMGVSGYPIHPYKALIKNEAGYYEMMFPKECVMRSQFYPHVTASNGTLYWFRTAHFRKDKAYYAKRLSVYEMPPERAVDIDTPDDFAWAEKMAALLAKSA